jgi:hypothetical protein
MVQRVVCSFFLEDNNFTGPFDVTALVLHGEFVSPAPGGVLA